MNFVSFVSRLLHIVLLKFKFNWEFCSFNLLSLTTLLKILTNPYSDSQLCSEEFLNDNLNSCQIVTQGQFY